MSLARALRDIWTLAVPYFKSEERWSAYSLLLAVIGLQLGTVGVQVLLNYWNRRFFNSMQALDVEAFWREIVLFTVLGVTMVVVATSQRYLSQWLDIRWRRWLTARYLTGWLKHGNHYRMQLVGNAVDNPDQRIQQDIQLFIERGMVIFLGFLGAVASLGAFIVILWNLSRQTPVPLFGDPVYIPGYLVWAALIYAVGATFLTHFVGRNLIPLNFKQQQYEADFRFDLVRVRENSEQIALLRGEPVERGRLMARFVPVVRNWHDIMLRTLKLTMSTSTVTVISLILPSLLVAPAFFSGQIQFGELMQTGGAFMSVYTSFSFIVVQYAVIAEWKSVVDRLTTFDKAMTVAETRGEECPLVNPPASEDGTAVEARDIRLQLPNGTPLIRVDGMRVGRGESVLINGPTGSGKSTFFRALGGIWPYGDGRLRMPDYSQVMLAPQRPYLPLGTLAGAICFPASPDTWSEGELVRQLEAVGLSKFVGQLHEVQHWDRQLSLGELQRIGFARVLLHRPRYLFLDESTSALDERSEALLYKLIQEQLPHTAVISIGHRSSLRAFHSRLFVVLEENGVRRLVEQDLPRGAAGAVS